MWTPATYEFRRYAEYLTSRAWFVKAQEAKEYYGWKCAICHSAGPLEVHHRTYVRLGRERLTDLIPLCEDCHCRYHGRLRQVPDQMRLPVAIH